MEPLSLCVWLGLFFPLCTALLLSLLNFTCQFITQSLRAVTQHCLDTSAVSVCAQRLQSSLIATYYTEKQKCAKQMLALFAFYLQDVLHCSGYRNNNCPNEKFLQERRLSSTCSKISVPVAPLSTLLYEQVNHGAELFPWICREAHGPVGMSVFSKSGMWGSGKCGEEAREGFQQLKGYKTVGD